LVDRGSQPRLAGTARIERFRRTIAATEIHHCASLEERVMTDYDNVIVPLCPARRNLFLRLANRASACRVWKSLMERRDRRERRGVRRPAPRNVLGELRHRRRAMITAPRCQRLRHNPTHFDEVVSPACFAIVA
jgi:hypothetical protein